ncbi:MAG: DUF1156 domain-containing protein, partial [Desulfobacteraceae bacterium]|nr:DUF1156 domain-containing protein [Desulfobacteraceae bacterium]
PLEALRLGCEAYALELNPVAHIIELCTLVYPQKYGKADPNAWGMTGPENEKGEKTWGGLAEEVRYWGNWVLEKVREEIGDLYPPIPDPDFKGKRPEIEFKKGHWVEKGKKANALEEWAGVNNGPPRGYLTPVAYLWTRTVKCKNPSCRATVPLVKQTWLCKKKGRYVAAKMIAPKGKSHVCFEIVEAMTEKGLGFDPSIGSKGGNATCPFCGTVADSNFVKSEGCAKRIEHQLMTVACTRRGSKGKVYISADDMPFLVPEEKNIHRKIKNLYKRTGLEVPKEPIEINPRSMDVDHWGFEKWRDLFTPRQLMCLLNFVWASREAEPQMDMQGYANEQKKAVATMMGAILDRLVDFNSTLCVFNYTGGRGVVHTFGRQSIPMVWDFAETDPFNPAGASWVSGIQDLPAGLRDANMRSSGIVKRGSAMDLPWPKSYFDAVITDPPYYDNVSYSNLSDFFYVWLKKTVGHLYPDHFASKLTPKKSEAIAAFYRHGGDKVKSRDAYEFMMAEAFRQANLVLKPNGHMVVVYAHKTTLGWATLIDSLQSTGFVVTEAWPINTEKPGRLLAQNTAALASSIFLVARKRDGSKIGSYENEVRSELRKIVLERVDTFWGMGITGADLVIAAVGAGLRAFTRFARVEYANGEEVHAE